MLCVPLGFDRADDLLAEHRRLVEQGVPLVEWRLDCLAESVELATLVGQRPGPTIVTARRPADGGRYPLDESRRVAMLHAAIAAGVEYVDLEPEVAGHVPRSGPTRRIVSLHDFSGTPADLRSRFADLAVHDADVIKLATLATCTHDNTRMLRLVADSPLPLVGLCMGDLGTPSRLLAGKFGAPWSYAAWEGGPPLAPGQVGFRPMREVYNYDRITRDTGLFGVIGDPIGHSLSPIVHNAAFRRAGLDLAYIPFRVPPADLVSFLDDAPELGLRGLSVTIPHKEAVLARLAECEDAVGEIGAANTLVWDGPRVRGYNTDRQAAIDSLALALGQPPERATFAGRVALVLGAGGAAKAIAHGLRQHGAEVLLASRTHQRAAELAASLGCQTIDWDARHEPPFDVLVNCTPLGMYPRVDESPLAAQALRPGMVVFDTVYNPVQTRLLADAARAGCLVVTGLEMFVRQAARQFELFTGQPAPIDVMRAALGP